MKIISVATPNELEAIFPVIRELRSHFSFVDCVTLVEEARRRDEYELVGAFEENQCIVVMGFRILFDFVHGKHLYIDDLVVTASCRSKGVGARLLKYAEQMAVEKNCKGLHLCTGVENTNGKRFYEREGWKMRSVAYKKTLQV